MVDFPPQPTFQLRLFLRMEKMKDVIVRHVSEPVIATRIIIIIERRDEDMFVVAPNVLGLLVAPKWSSGGLVLIPARA